MTSNNNEQIALNDSIGIEISIGTLSSLIAGLYCTCNAVDPIAIPTSIYIEIAEKLVPFLKEWDYSLTSFEEWVDSSLLIIPKVMCSDDDIEEFKQNTVYFERTNGNMIMVVTFRID